MQLSHQAQDYCKGALMDAPIVLHTSHLKKHFGSVRAVEDVSLARSSASHSGRIIQRHHRGKTGDQRKTVKVHVSNILSKLHLADRTQVAVYAWQKGLVNREQIGRK